MIIFKHSTDLKSYLGKIKKTNKVTGFVPTMGALHEGHLSLIDECRKNNNLTISSIFVNPVQFNNKDDFKNYPSTIEKDILLLEERGCDVLFMPGESEIYPNEASKERYYALGHLEQILEGKFRPGHFQGVCMVVDKLLTLIEPDYLYLGQKDYQQCLVIKKLISIIKKKTKVIICPIIREANGLAMSSRNLRLNEEEIKIASSLHVTLSEIKNKITTGNFLRLKEKAVAHLETEGFRVEYLELAETSRLEIVNDIREAKKYILLVAAHFGSVRLIDNLFLKD